MITFYLLHFLFCTLYGIVNPLFSDTPRPSVNPGSSPAESPEYSQDIMETLMKENRLILHITIFCKFVRNLPYPLLFPDNPAFFDKKKN
jgi:hypothetical protein